MAGPGGGCEAVPQVLHHGGRSGVSALDHHSENIERGADHEQEPGQEFFVRLLFAAFRDDQFKHQQERLG